MAGNTIDVEYLQQQKNAAEDYSKFHLQRVFSYRTIRSTFQPCSVDSYFDTLFENSKAVPKFKSDPSVFQVNKQAKLSLWDSVKSILHGNNEEISSRREAARKELQKRVDLYNSQEHDRCISLNKQLREQLQFDRHALQSKDCKQIAKYFEYVMMRDDYSLDSQNRWEVNCGTRYDPEHRRLVIDYELPSPDHISTEKSASVKKNGELEYKRYSQSEYSVIYETLIMDISMRSIGLAFESDTENVLSEVVFTGSCQYTQYPEFPIFIISMLWHKEEYEKVNIRQADFDCKNVLCALQEPPRYVGNVDPGKHSQEIIKCPPTKRIIPIASTLQGI